MLCGQKAGIKDHREHSEVCRRRLMEAMEGDEDGRRKKERDARRRAEREEIVNERLADEVEREENRRKEEMGKVNI